MTETGCYPVSTGGGGDCGEGCCGNAGKVLSLLWQSICGWIIGKRMKINRIQRLGTAVAAFVAGAVMCVCVYGAVTELPVTTVKGVKCYYYEVQPKESIYQVSHKLGVTREQITEHNPSAADGLKPRMRLYFPVSDFAAEPGTRKAVYAAAAGISTHVVKKGETVYGIARQYGMSPDYLARLNPQAADGIKVGDVLKITDDGAVAEAKGGADAPVATAARTGKPAGGLIDADGYQIYEIKPGDTLFSISNNHGVTLESVLEANPGLDPMHYNAGQYIRIPSASEVASASVGAGDVAAGSEPSAPAPEDMPLAASTVTPAPVAAVTPATGYADADDEGDYAESDGQAAADDDDDALAAVEREVMNVAVMLPFMLGEDSPSRTTQLYTEFFKGMLMAADTLRNDAGAQVKFHFYDTSASIDSVNAIMRRPEIADMDMVVAPDNSAQLAAIVGAVDPETLVLNIFAVKDETYKHHRNMIQTNIPHDAMYARAIDAFMDKYQGVLPVFLSRNGGLADKEPFVKALKERLTQEGRDFREVSFSSSLFDDDLAAFDPELTPVVFVPNSGSKNEFAKFVGAVTTLRGKASRPSNVTVFGYPEWITFRGESFDELCDLDATIYSRFLSNDSRRDIRKLKDSYKALYGEEMFEAVPTQGILGYDTGAFIIKGLRRIEDTGTFPSEYDGVQSYLKLGWSGETSTDPVSGELKSEGGLVNEALYIINYRPGGIVEWKK